MKFQTNQKITVLILLSALLAGCATGTKISDTGTTDNPEWKAWDKVTFNKTKGTFPNLQSLAQIRSGMTKDQLYELLGRPQYLDGWRPREWNYLFHFDTPGQGVDNITTCQYKVLFDKNGFSGSSYWNPVEPKSAVCPPGQPIKKAEVQRYTLSADVLFAFDKSSDNDLKGQGKVELQQLANKLKSFDELNSIQVKGYTDYLGSDHYNLALSQRRADTVRQYLIREGLPTHKISALGMGESDPVVNCSNKSNRTKLIQCLQPNRRVVIEVNGSGLYK